MRVERSDLRRRLGLTAAQNWVLFYALLTTHLEEMFPVIYTPTEADAIANYSHLFRRSEGLYLSPPLLDTMEEDFLDACEGRELDLVCLCTGHTQPYAHIQIVVSDAEAILGIGDQARRLADAPAGLTSRAPEGSVSPRPRRLSTRSLPASSESS